MEKQPVSVLIPTKNEKRNIVDCIRSVAWAAQIVVFDSYSDDETVALAQREGALVIQRTFDNFSDHKNWALSNAPFEHEWILIVDADERVGPELANEIAAVAHDPHAAMGYYIARQNLFAGKWIRHGGWYPDWQLRLFRRGRARYEQRLVHEHMLLDGQPAFLKHHLIHYDHKGIERYFDRHNTYSSLEAVEAFIEINGATATRNQLSGSLLAKGPHRRRLLKHLAYRYLPFRPLFKFLWMYVLRLGFLDGAIGFRFCLLHTFYDYQISLKLAELRDANSPMAEKYGALIRDVGKRRP